MAAYSKLQEREFQLEKERGFRAIKHQSFVGAGYFDEVNKTITRGDTSVTALAGSTEEEQFKEIKKDTVEIHPIDTKAKTPEISLPKLKRKKVKAS